MWVIQNQGLLRIPDDVPVPPDSVKVELPSDFQQQTHTYKIEGKALIKRSAAELKKLQRPGETLKMMQEEIAKLKQAVAGGKYEHSKKSKRSPSRSSR